MSLLSDAERRELRGKIKAMVPLFTAEQFDECFDLGMAVYDRFIDDLMRTAQLARKHPDSRLVFTLCAVAINYSRAEMLLDVALEHVKEMMQRNGVNIMSIDINQPLDAVMKDVDDMVDSIIDSLDMSAEEKVEARKQLEQIRVRVREKYAAVHKGNG